MLFRSAIAGGWDFVRMIKRAFRPRVLVYTGILWTVIIASGITLLVRVPLKVDVIRDRASLAREVDDGKIENVYRLQMMNTDEKPRRFNISVSGGHDLKHLEVLVDTQPVELPPVSVKSVTVRVRAEPEHARRGTERIDFRIDETGLAAPGDKPVTISEKSAFFVPGR